MWPGELGVGVERVARHIERRDAEPGLLDSLFQAPYGVGVAEQLVRRAVGDGGVPADTQLQVLDQAGSGCPAGDFGQGPVGHRVGEKAGPQRIFGAFQNCSSTYGLRLPLSITPAKTVDRAALHELAVELKTKSRPVRHRQTTVRVDPWLFDEDLAQVGCRPPRGVVRELEP